MWSRVRLLNHSFIRVDVRSGFFCGEMDVVAVDEYGHRAVATRYDKLAVCYPATVHIAAINKWLRSV